MNIEETITEAYYSLLDGNVTVGSYTFPVYRTNADISESSHYILLRKEGSTDEWNKSYFPKRFVLVAEIVTVFGEIINDKLVDDADEVMYALVITSPTENSLGLDGVQVIRGTVNYLDEDNGSNKIYRKISRFINQIN